MSTPSIFFIIWFLCWGVFAIPIYVYANRIGRNGISYVLLSLLISPLFSYLLLVANGSSEAQNLENKIREREMEVIAVNKVSSRNSMDLKYERLEKLGSLKEKGVLTEEEFLKEKEKILSTNTDNSASIPAELNNLYLSIKKAKKSRLNADKEAVLHYMRQQCTDKSSTIDLIKEYRNSYKEDIVESLKNLSNSYSVIKEYLKPFIEYGIVSREYPHYYISST